MKIDFLALYGAVVGTIAILLQLRQWWLDRAILKVEASIIRHESPMEKLESERITFNLVIRAVNNGRRPVTVRTVGAFLAVSLLPDENGFVPEEASAETLLFGGTTGNTIEISPDGGQRTWEQRIFKGRQFLSHKKGNEQYGKAYVELTSGEKAFCDFRLRKDNEWPASAPSG